MRFIRFLFLWGYNCGRSWPIWRVTVVFNRDFGPSLVGREGHTLDYRRLIERVVMAENNHNHNHDTEERKVLIVDAHSAVRQGLRHQIDGVDGLGVGATAGTIREALEVGAECTFDLAIVDEHLPDGAGLDLCRRLTEAGQVRECVLHAGTGIDPTDAIAAGVSAVVLKQLSGSDLVDTMQRLAGSQPRNGMSSTTT